MPTATTSTAEATPHKLTYDEGVALLDRLARRYLGVSGAEFVRAWRNGEYDAKSDTPEVMRVAMLVPLAG